MANLAASYAARDKGRTPTPGRIWASMAALPDRRLAWDYWRVFEGPCTSCGGSGKDAQGNCWRCGGRGIIGIREDDAPQPAAPSPRAQRVFEVGHQRHDALRRALAESAPPECVIPRTEREEEPLAREIPLNTGGRRWVISVRPDGLLLCPVEIGSSRVEPPAILEIKTVTSFAARRMHQGDYGDRYLIQMHLGAHAHQARGSVLLYEQKETQQLGIAYVPLQPVMVQKVLRRLARLAPQLGTVDPLELPLCEGDDYGTREQGSATVLRWGCSYCPWAQHCYPSLRRYLLRGRQVAVVEGQPPKGAEPISEET